MARVFARLPEWVDADAALVRRGRDILPVLEEIRGARRAHQRAWRLSRASKSSAGSARAHSAPSESVP